MPTHDLFPEDGYPRCSVHQVIFKHDSTRGWYCPACTQPGVPWDGRLPWYSRLLMRLLS